jgi:hypothetical protein
MPKSAPSLGFDLDELAGTVAGYEGSAKASAPTAAPAQVGRPRSLARDAKPVSVRLDGDQRRWLLEEAARRTLASGERHDVSRIVRELVDNARGASG